MLTPYAAAAMPPLRCERHFAAIYYDDIFAMRHGAASDAPGARCRYDDVTRYTMLLSARWRRVLHEVICAAASA